MLWKDTSHSPYTWWPLNPALTSSQTFTLFKNTFSEKMSVRVVVVCVWWRHPLKPNEHLTFTQHFLHMTSSNQGPLSSDFVCRTEFPAICLNKCNTMNASFCFGKMLAGTQQYLRPAFIQTYRGSWWRLHISLGWSLWPSGQWRSGSPAHDTKPHRAQLMTPHEQSWSLYCQGFKFLTAGMAWTENFWCDSALVQISCLTYTYELLSSNLIYSY